MELYYFLKSSFRKTFATVIIGIASFVVVLITTLNLTSAILVFLLFLATAVFQNSFSRGWLFLLMILLLLPTMKISGTSFLLHDVFLVILSVIGLSMILFENLKIPLTSISYNFFLFELIGLSVVVFAKIFGQNINQMTILIILTMATYWVSMISLQYFFQTMKRMRRFFLLIVAVGVTHSLFGLFSYAVGFQTPSGLGISSGKIQFLIFENIRYQINGFLGDGYSLRVGFSALAPFLLISIPLTYATALNIKKKIKTTRPLKRIEKTVKFFDSAHFSKKQFFTNPAILSTLKERLSREKIHKMMSSRSFVWFLMSLQVVALVFTFSYVSILICMVGIFAMAILLRDKKLITLTMVLVIIFSVVLPGTFSSVMKESELNISKWFSGWEVLKHQWIWGSGWQMAENGGGAFVNIKNSYLLVWSQFGIFGFLVFISILARCFKELYDSYRTSDGEKRIWLIAIFGIFVEFLFLGFMGNVFFFGPAALVFWLLCGTLGNLKSKQIVFGVTETKLAQKTLFH